VLELCNRRSRNSSDQYSTTPSLHYYALTMPGFVLHLGATVLCAHAGQAQPTAPNPRVLVSGQPVTTQVAPYVVAGCPFVPPGGNGPCVTAQWVVGATRVLASGQPVLTQTSVAICAPTGTPLNVIVTQMRVIAT
jgi:hypothetical protein